MNVYDGAHNLASAIKQSDEFKEFKKYEEQLKANPDLEKMINDFQQKSMEIQMKQMSGEELGPEAMQSIQQLYGIAILVYFPSTFSPLSVLLHIIFIIACRWKSNHHAPLRSTNHLPILHSVGEALLSK